MLRTRPILPPEPPPEPPPDYVGDYIGSTAAHLAGGTLDDGRLLELLDAISSRHVRAEGLDRRLTPGQHARAKEVACLAVLARGGAYSVDAVCWRSDGVTLQATLR
jgi:hypothetical protein